MSKFGNRLRMLRESKNLNQEELASVLSVSKQTISNYENGKREANYLTLEALADFFNVDMNYLLGKTNKTTVLPERLVHEGKQVIFKDGNFTLSSPTRKLKPGADKLIGGQLLAMTEPTKEAKGAQEQEVEYYPGTDEPTREYMLDFIDREYPTAAFSGGDIHTMNYEELREYYEAVLEEIREEDGE